jgi:hypothetical protein
VTALAAEPVTEAAPELGQRFIYQAEEVAFMRLVCGLDIRGTALAMGRSERVVERYWAHVKTDRNLRRRVLRRYRLSR